MLLSQIPPLCILVIDVVALVFSAPGDGFVVKRLTPPLGTLSLLFAEIQCATASSTLAGDRSVRFASSTFSKSPGFCVAPFAWNAALAGAAPLPPRNILTARVPSSPYLGGAGIGRLYEVLATDDVLFNERDAPLIISRAFPHFWHVHTLRYKMRPKMAEKRLSSIRCAEAVDGRRGGSPAALQPHVNLAGVRECGNYLGMVRKGVCGQRRGGAGSRRGQGLCSWRHAS